MSSSRLSRMVVLAIGTATAAGCASLRCPPFRVAWYAQEQGVAPPASTASAPNIYLALMNRGDRSADVKRVMLNPSKADGGMQINGVGKLEPGRLRLIRIDQLLGNCVLPVRVKIECDDGCPRTQEIDGALPNYLHDAWVSSCVR